MSDENSLPVMTLDDLPLDQVMDTLATSYCHASSSVDNDDDDIEGMIEDYDISDLDLEEEQHEELEPDDEFSEEEAGDFDYDTEED